jgi:hypothetical protein
MMGGGGSGGRNSGDGDGKDSSSSDSAKKSNKPKKEHQGGGDSSSSDSAGKKHDSKKDDSGKKNKDGEDNGNTNSISGTGQDLINDLFGISNESSSSTTTTEQQQPVPSSPAEPAVYQNNPPKLPENYESDQSYKKLGDGSIVKSDRVMSPTETQRLSRVSIADTMEVRARSQCN